MNDERFEELLKQRLAEMAKTGERVGFVGNICEGPCPGWDGLSYRCDCGTFRVMWRCDGQIVEGIYADAW